MAGQRDRRRPVGRHRAPPPVWRQPTVAAVAAVAIVIALAVVGWRVLRSDAPAVTGVGAPSATGAAAADVTVTSCQLASTGRVIAEMSIVNHSLARANYSISVAIEGKKKARLAAASVSLNNVEPGTTATDNTAVVLSGPPPTVTCRLEKVQRTAS